MTYVAAWAKTKKFHELAHPVHGGWHRDQRVASDAAKSADA